MNRRLLVVLIAFTVVPLVFFGCKGRVEKSAETQEALEPAQDIATAPVTEPAQDVAQETIPPTAAPQGIEAPRAASPTKTDRTRDFQKALKNAGFYAGAVDGVIGPKTRRAIEDFQKAKGLKVDGKIGPKTWAELEKYLTQ